MAALVQIFKNVGEDLSRGAEKVIHSKEGQAVLKVAKKVEDVAVDVGIGVVLHRAPRPGEREAIERTIANLPQDVADLLTKPDKRRELLKSLDKIMVRVMQGINAGVKLFGADIVVPLIMSETGMSREEATAMISRTSIENDIRIAKTLVKIGKIINSITNIVSIGFKKLEPVANTIGDWINLAESILEIASAVLKLQDAIERGDDFLSLLDKTIAIADAADGVTGSGTPLHDLANALKGTKDVIDHAKSGMEVFEEEISDITKVLSFSLTRQELQALAIKKLEQAEKLFPDEVKKLKQDVSGLIEEGKQAVGDLIQEGTDEFNKQLKELRSEIESELSDELKGVVKKVADISGLEKKDIDALGQRITDLTGLEQKDLNAIRDLIDKDGGKIQDLIKNQLKEGGQIRNLIENQLKDVRIVKELKQFTKGVQEDVNELQSKFDNLEKKFLALVSKETNLEVQEERIRKKVGLRKITVLTDEQKEKRNASLAKGRATSKANRATKKKQDRIDEENVEDKRTTRGIGVSKRRKKANSK